MRIGVGEVPRRIIAKAILHTIGKDTEEAAGPLQVCAGQDGGCEAAVHAMHIVNMKQQRKGNTQNVFVKWSVLSSHPLFSQLFSQQLVEWVVKLQQKDWPMEFHGRRESNIQSSWGGFNVVSPLQSSVLLSCAFVEADPLVTAPHTN